MSARFELALALDPNDNKVLYLFAALGAHHIYNHLPWNIYKSVDGGKNFTATTFSAAAKFTIDDQYKFGSDFEPSHYEGDRLAVDPNNSNVVYIGTGTKGLFRSADAGASWSAMTGGGIPAGINCINILCYKKGGTAAVNGVTVSKIVYLVTGGGKVYSTQDGGVSWTDTRLDAKGSTNTACYAGVLDPNTGALYQPTHTASLLRPAPCGNTKTVHGPDCRQRFSPAP